jgi:hypothetical protein
LAGFSSGEYGGRKSGVVLLGQGSSLERCQPAPSITSTAWSPRTSSREIPPRNCCIEKTFAFDATNETERSVRGSTAPKTHYGLASVLPLDHRTHPALGPDPRERSLLAEPRLVLEDHADPLPRMLRLHNLD